MISHSVGCAKKHSLPVFTLVETIDRCFAKIEYFYGKYGFDESYDEIIKKTENLLGKGMAAEDCFLDSFIEYEIIPTHNGPQPTYLMNAIVLATYARISHEEGDANRAWSFIAQANLDVGLAENFLYSTDKDSIARNIRRELSSSGGQAKSEKMSRSAKNEAIRLFQAKCPTDGWNNKDDAVAEILNDLEFFVKNNNGTIKNKKLHLEVDNLSITLGRWLSEDQEVSAAYEANSAEKLKLSNPE